MQNLVNMIGMLAWQYGRQMHAFVRTFDMIYMAK